MYQCLLSSTKINVLKITNNQIDKLYKFGFKNLIDLLLHLPIRYKNKTRYSLINNIKSGEKVFINGIIVRRNILYKKNNRILICTLKYEGDLLTVIFFHARQSIIKLFTPGKKFLIYGLIRFNSLQNRKEIIHPEYEVFNERKKNSIFSFVPVYPKVFGIKQKELRSIINQALKKLDKIYVSELLPYSCSKNMMDISSAIKLLHNPPLQTSIKELQSRSHPANFRLIFEELLSYNLSFLKAKLKIKSKKAIALHINSDLVIRFLSTLPFHLTNSQNRVISEINKDLSRTTPMIRLLQGDVGSGKTIIAALSSLCAISTNKQVAVMVPTETLAIQHERTFKLWFNPIGVTVISIFGKQNINEKKMKQKCVSSGKAMIVIGTHSVIQKKLKFLNLGLIIIDEQHKFGVYQRFALFKKGLSKGFYPHQLIMTATPIPRTLTMMLHSILDISVIRDIPPNRHPIKTVVLSGSRREEIMLRINEICTQEHRQIYWICTSIRRERNLSINTVESVYKELVKKVPNLKVGLLHSRIHHSEKKIVIEKFRSGTIDILVSTSIVEVGIDIPNASIMIIEDSNKFGLSQLHQLRGRIGRGNTFSYCICLYNQPISKNAENRLRIFRTVKDGFFIAQYDLKIRGPGEFLGKNQAGDFKFKVANLFHDYKLLPKIYKFADYICKNDPDSMNKLITRWISNRFPDDISI